MMKISDSEWEVMERLWKESPKTSSQLIKELGALDWKPTTIKTLIARLVEKEVITFVKEGKKYYYSPAVSKEECMVAKNDFFLNKFYKGMVKNLLVSFIDHEDLTKHDIEDLKRILDEKEKGAKK